jgi:hypothetical protein
MTLAESLFIALCAAHVRFAACRLSTVPECLPCDHQFCLWRSGGCSGVATEHTLAEGDVVLAAAA